MPITPVVRGIATTVRWRKQQNILRAIFVVKKKSALSLLKSE
jgi:hypothetical protein